MTPYYYGCTSILTVVVGDGPTSPNIAYPVYIDERSITGTFIKRMALRSTRGPNGEPACTLGAGQGAWNQDSDGMPSLSVDGKVAVLMCFDTPAGSSLDCSVAGNENNGICGAKVIAMIRDSGRISYTAAFTNTFQGITATAGLRQVATEDGSRFWLAGGGATYQGYRYLASTTSTTSVGILGEQSGEKGYNGGTGIAIAGSTLYAVDGATLFTIASVSGALRTTVAAAGDATDLANTANGAYSLVSSQGPTSLWYAIPKSTSTYGVLAFSATNGWGGTAYPFDDTGTTVFSTSARDDEVGTGTGTGRWTIYSASTSKVYRSQPNPSPGPNTVLVTASTDAVINGASIRGVVVAPHDRPQGLTCPVLTHDTTTCFPLSATVTVRLPDGRIQSRRLADVHVGDRVLTYSGSSSSSSADVKTSWSSVYVLSDRAEAANTTMLRLHLANGRALTLSHGHYAAVSSPGCGGDASITWVRADSVRYGDGMWSLPPGQEHAAQLQCSLVTAIDPSVLVTGYVSPFTLANNIVVVSAAGHRL